MPCVFAVEREERQKKKRMKRLCERALQGRYFIFTSRNNPALVPAVDHIIIPRKPLRIKKDENKIRVPSITLLHGAALSRFFFSLSFSLTVRTAHG